MDKDKQILILVDDEGNKIGHENRLVCHAGKGKRHLAFVVLLTSRSEFLIQKRKHKLFDGLWDVSCTSHPVHIDGKDEKIEEAAKKCMQRELGITTDMKNIGAFNYFAQHGEFCENEHCAILIGKIKEDPRPNQNEIYEVRWISLAELVEEIETYPENFTPWIKHTVDFLKGNVSHLGSSVR